MSKQAKKRPKPVPCEAWCTIGTDHRIHLAWCSIDGEVIGSWRKAGCRVIRVRIVPVVAKAKRRKGAK